MSDTTMQRSCGPATIYDGKYSNNESNCGRSAADQSSHAMGSRAQKEAILGILDEVTVS